MRGTDGGGGGDRIQYRAIVWHVQYRVVFNKSKQEKVVNVRLCLIVTVRQVDNLALHLNTLLDLA